MYIYYSKKGRKDHPRNRERADAVTPTLNYKQFLSMDINKNQSKSTEFTQAVKTLLAEKGCSHLFWENDIIYFMHQSGATPCKVANCIIEENGGVSDFTAYYL